MAKTEKQIIKIVEDYEAKLRKKGSLVMNIDLKLSKKSLQDFLIDFFYHNHLASSDQQRPAEKLSYTQLADIDRVVKSNNNQCRAGARRSIGDLFQIVLGHYSNKITLIEVMEAVMGIVNDEIPISSKDGRYKHQIYSSVCHTINRRVFNSTAFGGKGRYKFSRENPEYSTGSDVSHDEFTIVMEDYLILASNNTFKTYREEKERERKTKNIIVNDDDELDKEVMRKIAALLAGDSDNAAIVKPVKRKKVA